MLREVSQIPTGPQLAEIFSKVFKARTQEELEYSSLPLSLARDMSLEWSISLPCWPDVRLNLRTDKSFSIELSELIWGRRGDEEGGRAALKELFKQFAIVLASGLEGEGCDQAAFLPVPTLPLHWPDKKPDAACAMKYKRHVLELRLWQEKKA
jgi:hypothetical protein